MNFEPILFLRFLIFDRSVWGILRKIHVFPVFDEVSKISKLIHSTTRGFQAQWLLALEDLGWVSLWSKKVVLIRSVFSRRFENSVKNGQNGAQTTSQRR